MRRQPLFGLAGAFLAAIVVQTAPRVTAGSPPPDVIDAAFQGFWSASIPRDAAKAADRLLRDGVDFDTAWTRLKRGRAYGMAPTGQRIERNRIADQTFENTVEIPESYDPSRAWSLRVQLHGGINREDPQAQDIRRRPRTNRLMLDDPEIVILPSGWRDASWWHTNQVDNILSIVDRVKRAYNVDESRVYLTGVSDGGSGSYYFALREATPWSAFLPLNGSLAVLANPAVGADGELFVGNLVNRPFFIINGGRDPLYPLVQIEPHVDLMRRAGVSMAFRPQPLAGHDTTWWPSEQAAFAAFVRDHPRAPYPERLSWETDRVDRANRIDWLVIEALGVAPSDTPLDDVNMYSPRHEPDFGVRADRAVDAGTRLMDVRDGSDGYRMGLRKGDRIVEVDGAAVRNAAEVAEAMGRHDPVRPIAIVVERKGERQTIAGKFPPELIVAPPRPLFTHRHPSGRVDLVRRGNTIEAKSRGVRTFRLLLSPDAIDFSQPLTVTVNGRPSFQGTVAKDPAVLLRWAARDNDRTMLFGAEVKIQVP